MQLWQYNAASEAYQERIVDELSIQIQSAYYGAYWNSASKHKRSLKSVLNSLRSKKPSQSKDVAPIDIKKVSEQFRQMEELKENGWTKCN